MQDILMNTFDITVYSSRQFTHRNLALALR